MTVKQINNAKEKAKELREDLRDFVATKPSWKKRIGKAALILAAGYLLGESRGYAVGLHNGERCMMTVVRAACDDEVYQRVISAVTLK